MDSYTAGRFFEFLKWALCPFFMYRDVLYAVGAWMRRNGDYRDVLYAVGAWMRRNGDYRDGRK